ncbi:hypothetical protein CP03DC29_0389B, partial [Chlamydia psittaci 03DC29]
LNLGSEIYVIGSRRTSELETQLTEEFYIVT